MSTVVEQPYTVGFNGGRKLIRLSNGWLVAATRYTSTHVIYFYVSKDGGATWQQLCLTQSVGNNDWAIASKGTLLFLVYSAPTGAGLVKFDVVNVTNTEQIGVPFEASQISMGRISLAINPQGTELHVAWTSTNSAYSSAHNLRYKKGTINSDGSLTWGNTEQLTSINVSGYNMQNPTVVVNSSGNAVVICGENAGSSMGNVIVAYSKSTPAANSHMTNATVGWGNRLIYNGMTYEQSNPSAVVDKNGRIWVAWQSYLGQLLKIRVSYSDDGGIVWSTPQQMDNTENTQTTPSLSIDKNNNVFIAWQEISPAYLVYGIKTNKYSNGAWGAPKDVALQYPVQKQYASILYDSSFSTEFDDIPPLIYTNGVASVEYIGAFVTNQPPVMNLAAPINNQTLYENETFNISGTVLDADNGNTVTVRYQINALATRAIKAYLSDGTALEAFSKSLTFKGGSLYDGDTLIASNLTDGAAHTLKIWATDDQGGTSTIKEIPFYVVPNRAPLLTVNSPVINGLINSDKFTISGTFEDSDGNTTIVSYRINGSTSVQIAEGVSGPFTFDVSFGQLVIGENQIVVEAVDSYGAKVSKTIKLNKNEVKTEQLRSTARYKINPPTGSASGVLLWIQRDENLDIDVAISMTMQGEAESFVPLTVSNSAPLDQNSPIIEDEFYHEADGTKDNIILQIDMERGSLEVSDKIYLISGVLD